MKAKAKAEAVGGPGFRGEERREDAKRTGREGQGGHDGTALGGCAPKKAWARDDVGKKGRYAGTRYSAFPGCREHFGREEADLTAGQVQVQVPVPPRSLCIRLSLSSFTTWVQHGKPKVTAYSVYGPE